MTKTILTLLILASAASTLSACVEYRGAPRAVVVREGFVPGHYDRAGDWIPGHYR